MSIYDIYIYNRKVNIMQKGSNRKKWARSELALYVLLILISLTFPLLSYAGVSLIYPPSTITADVNQNPPITWAQGNDYTLASNSGFAGSFTTANNAASFTLTVSGLSGGNVTIDRLLNVTATSRVTSFTVKISTALSGSLTPNILKLRFWTGGTAPTSDSDSGVAGVLDLTATAGTATASMNGGTTYKVQLIFALPSSVTTQTATVSIQPDQIILN